MPDNDHYKLLRTGSVRVGAARSLRGGRSGRYRESTHMLVPDIEAFGHQPFSTEHLRALAQRMQDCGSPRGALNIYGLEGLLTALLVLPLGLRPTVWLPLVWNESGWKIPVALQLPDRFCESLESMIGFMRMIDNGLRAAMPRFESTLDTLPADYRPKTLHALQDWAMGFGLAIKASSHLTVVPDSAVHRALYVIATHAKPATISTHERRHGLSPALRQAVLTLANARTSRGPLGALATKV